MSAKYKALLYGDDASIASAVANVYREAGFLIDLISSNRTLATLTDRTRFVLVRNSSDMVSACLSALNRSNYDFVVPVNDRAIELFLSADISTDAKLRALPVMAQEYLGHLYSKISLSEIFRQNNVRTPRYVVASLHAAVKLLEECGRVLCKIDKSGGGEGVFDCTNKMQLIAKMGGSDNSSMLVQEFIEGEYLSIEALYSKGSLIHFALSDNMVPMDRSPFAPTKARTFVHSSLYDDHLIEEIKTIGRVLGVTGWLNIGCTRESKSGHNFYFEADARPNVWVDRVPFTEDRASVRLRKWMQEQEIYRYARSAPTSGSCRSVQAFTKRMSLSDLLLNRYNSWRALGSMSAVLRCLLSRLIVEFRRGLRKLGRRFLRSSQLLGRLVALS